MSLVLISLTVNGSNAVPSPNNPNSSKTVPNNDSLSWDNVILQQNKNNNNNSNNNSRNNTLQWNLDGIACGLMIISGRIPSAVKGMSTSGTMFPHVPFCPHRLENLSPITGLRSVRSLTCRNKISVEYVWVWGYTLEKLYPSPFLLIKFWSM